MLCPHGLPGEGAPAAPRAAPSPPAGPPSERPPPPSAPSGHPSDGPPAASPTVPTEPPPPARGGPYLPPPLRAAPADSTPSLLDPGTERDPYPLYRTLRGRFPLLYDEPFDAWLISRYADVRAALADPRLAAPEPGPALAHLDTGAPDAHRALVSRRSRTARPPPWPPASNAPRTSWPCAWPTVRTSIWWPSSASGCPPRRSSPPSGCRTRPPRACTPCAGRASTTSGATTPHWRTCWASTSPAAAPTPATICCPCCARPGPTGGRSPTRP